MILDIFDRLKADGCNPYFVGQHEGLVARNYVVVREGDTIPSLPSNRIGQKVIDIIIYVPIRQYIQIEPYKNKVKDSLRKLSYLRKTGHETPVITEDELKAYSSSIEYVLQKKLEG